MEDQIQIVRNQLKSKLEKANVEGGLHFFKYPNGIGKSTAVIEMFADEDNIVYCTTRLNLIEEHLNRFNVRGMKVFGKKHYCINENNKFIFNMGFKHTYMICEDCDTRCEYYDKMKLIKEHPEMSLYMASAYLNVPMFYEKMCNEKTTLIVDEDISQIFLNNFLINIKTINFLNDIIYITTLTDNYINVELVELYLNLIKLFRLFLYNNDYEVFDYYKKNEQKIEQNYWRLESCIIKYIKSNPLRFKLTNNKFMLSNMMSYIKSVLNYIKTNTNNLTEKENIMIRVHATKEESNNTHIFNYLDFSLTNELIKKFHTILYLSATADLNQTQNIFGTKNLTLHINECLKPNLFIIQTKDRNAASTIEKHTDKFDKLLEVVKLFKKNIIKNKKLLLISKMMYEDKLKLYGETEHFYGIAGTNKYENYDNMVVFGSAFMNEPALNASILDDNISFREYQTSMFESEQCQCVGRLRSINSDHVKCVLKLNSVKCGYEQGAEVVILSEDKLIKTFNLEYLEMYNLLTEKSIRNFAKLAHIDRTEAEFIIRIYTFYKLI